MANNEKKEEIYKILGTGTFGAVFTPALNNINNNITKRNRNKYVTKIFFNKTAYNNLQTRRNKISKIMKSHKGSLFEPYQRNIILGQLNNKIKNTITNTIKTEIINKKLEEKLIELDENKIDENEKERLLNEYGNKLNIEIEIPNNTQLYGIRMPILGKSFDSLDRAFVNNICNKCSILNILSECNKLFKITEYLAENGYIHGDLESRNILLSIDHNKCELSIIDYDRFDTFDEYIRKYVEALEEGSFFPYGPPESTILVKDISSNKEDKNKKSKKNPNYKNNINDRIIEWIKNRIYYWQHWALKKKTIKKYYTRNDEQQFTDEIKDIVFKFIDSGKKVKLKYFDNFILGLTLLNFFRKLYDIDEFDMVGYENLENKTVLCKSMKINSDEKIALTEFRDNVLYPMTSLTVENRIDPKEVVKRMEKILCKFNKNENKSSSCSIQGGKRRKTRKNTYYK